GLKPHIVVSDLDGLDLNDLKVAVNLGAYLIIHAHGDNIEQIKRYPSFLAHKTFGTMQSNSLENVFNIGGFTDGDRALIIAESCDPKEIFLAGMEFGEIVGEYSKKNMPFAHMASQKKRLKLKFGEMIVEWVKKTAKVTVKHI
ncbi:MAG: 6-hydroxymethylpterin diphosphokinase MptE-like protein, partial [Candidatus Odinarchaeia archaeon]